MFVLNAPTPVPSPNWGRGEGVGVSGIMKELNLPGVDLRTRMNQGKHEVFDPVRKRHVSLTAEEWVRQHFLYFLIIHKNVPPSLIAVEASIKYNNLSKRCDIVVYNRNGQPVLIVECKAPEVEINQDVFQQVAMYNMTLKVRFLVFTNGMDHYICEVDHEKGSFRFLKDIPDFEEMNSK
jgi:type I site-specific restriction-modification system R (restriction) subunit